ncbi:MAG: NAD(P)H-dependent oxidoreductase, partial [Thermodesulfobacteriota bacterium]|nr:NAD(P)H-dependent oxidoreductase [Thermodesulfobacteriota bacterium]
MLLGSFLEESKALGAETLHIEVAHKKISPCMECGTCEEEGFCPIDDEMQGIYPLLRRADVVLMATPIYFYGATAQIKALIDRCQALWARRYTYKLEDPGLKSRLGLLLALGATRGKNLFEGVSLTAKYFFDAMGADFKGSLTYREIEGLQDIKRHPTALMDAKEKARAIMDPFLKRKKILFVCKENACRSQMASAFTRYSTGDRIE